MALKLLEAIVGESESVGFTDPKVFDYFFETPDFTIVVVLRKQEEYRVLECTEIFEGLMFREWKVVMGKKKGLYRENVSGN